MKAAVGLIAISAVFEALVCAAPVGMLDLEAESQAINKLFNEAIAQTGRGKEVDSQPLREALLEYADKFPGERETTRRLAGRLFEYASEFGMAENSASQIAFVEDMKRSLNALLREFGIGKERIYLMRTQPADLRFKDIGGRTIDLADYRGNVVLLDFWSASCSVCVEAMPALKKLYGEYHQQGFEIISVLFSDAGVPRTRALLEKLGLPWPNSVQEWKGSNDTYLSRYFSFSYVPNYFLLDRKGRLVTTDLDHCRGPKVEREVRQLLGLPSLSETETEQTAQDKKR